MKTFTTTVFAVLLAAASVLPSNVAGKFAFGFEQGVGAGSDNNTQIGRGFSFKYCVNNNVAIEGVLGLNYSAKISPIKDGTTADNTVYQEDKYRVDWAAGAYGVFAFWRSERLHFNGITGVLFAARDNHFTTESEVIPLDSTSYHFAKNNLGEPSKLTEIHLRVLMAPEIFIFPNFSIEYKYGLDVSLKQQSVIYPGGVNPDPAPRRLNVDMVGDLNLLTNASVHLYF